MEEVPTTEHPSSKFHVVRNLGEVGRGPASLVKAYNMIYETLS
jgi:hypothetical protein